MALAPENVDGVPAIGYPDFIALRRYKICF